MAPRWLSSRGKMPRRGSKPADGGGGGGEQPYCEEHWNAFHKKHSSYNYRSNHEMKFSDIWKQQRRQASPSWTDRILRFLGRGGGRPPTCCFKCGSKQHNTADCNVYMSPETKRMKKKSPRCPICRKGRRKRKRRFG